MSQCHPALQLLEYFIGKDFRNEAHIFMQADTRTIRYSYPGAFLTAMLKCIQPVIGQAGHIQSRSVNAKNTAFLFRFVTIIVFSFRAVSLK